MQKEVIEKDEKNNTSREIENSENALESHHELEKDSQKSIKTIKEIAEKKLNNKTASKKEKLFDLKINPIKLQRRNSETDSNKSENNSIKELLKNLEKHRELNKNFASKNSHKFHRKNLVKKSIFGIQKQNILEKDLSDGESSDNNFEVIKKDPDNLLINIINKQLENNVINKALEKNEKENISDQSKKEDLILIGNEINNEEGIMTKSDVLLSIKKKELDESYLINNNFNNQQNTDSENLESIKKIKINSNLFGEIINDDVYSDLKENTKSQIISLKKTDKSSLILNDLENSVKIKDSFIKPDSSEFIVLKQKFDKILENYPKDEKITTYQLIDNLEFKLKLDFMKKVIFSAENKDSSYLKKKEIQELVVPEKSNINKIILKDFDKKIKKKEIQELFVPEKSKLNKIILKDFDKKIKKNHKHREEEINYLIKENLIKIEKILFDLKNKNKRSENQKEKRKKKSKTLKKNSNLEKNISRKKKIKVKKTNKKSQEKEKNIKNLSNKKLKVSKNKFYSLKSKRENSFFLRNSNIKYQPPTIIRKNVYDLRLFCKHDAESIIYDKQKDHTSKKNTDINNYFLFFLNPKDLNQLHNKKSDKEINQSRNINRGSLFNSKFNDDLNLENKNISKNNFKTKQNSCLIQKNNEKRSLFTSSKKSLFNNSNFKIHDEDEFFTIKKFNKKLESKKLKKIIKNKNPIFVSLNAFKPQTIKNKISKKIKTVKTQKKLIPFKKINGINEQNQISNLERKQTLKNLSVSKSIKDFDEYDYENDLCNFCNK